MNHFLVTLYLEKVEKVAHGISMHTYEPKYLIL